VEAVPADGVDRHGVAGVGGEVLGGVGLLMWVGLGLGLGWRDQGSWFWSPLTVAKLRHQCAQARLDREVSFVAAKQNKPHSPTQMRAHFGALDDGALLGANQVLVLLARRLGFEKGGWGENGRSGLPGWLVGWLVG